MSVGEAVKNRIIELCSLRGISINKLCSMSGVTQSTVNNIISGRNQSTSVATIKKLCDGLDITFADFFSTPEFDALKQPAMGLSRDKNAEGQDIKHEKWQQQGWLTAVNHGLYEL